MLLRSSWPCQPQQASAVPSPHAGFTPDYLWLPSYGNRLWHKNPDTPLFGPAVDPEVFNAGTNSLIGVPGGVGYGNTSLTGYVLWQKRTANIAYPLCVGGVFVRTAGGGGGTGFCLSSSAGTTTTAPRLVIGFDASNVARGDVRMARSGGTLSTLLGTITIPLDTPFAAILIARNATDRKLIMANETITSTSSLATVADQWSFVGMQAVYRGGVLSGLDGYTLMGFASTSDPGDDWAQRWVNNPWSLVAAPSRWLPDPVAVSVYRPGSDIAVSGWTPSTGTDLFACIDETTASDTDYITSPDLSTSATMGLTASVPIGTWAVAYRGRFVLTTGSIRMVLLDSSSSVVGTSAWQAQSGSFSDYTAVITTTGIADRIRIEVQP